MGLKPAAPGMVSVLVRRARWECAGVPVARKVQRVDDARSKGQTSHPIHTERLGESYERL